MIPFTEETANNRLSLYLNPSAGQNYSADIQQNTIRERLNHAIFTDAVIEMASCFGAL